MITTIIGSNGSKKVDVDALLHINTDLARSIIVGFIRDALKKVGTGKAVIGLSGGIDSALSAFLTAEAIGTWPTSARAISWPASA
jgi:NAD+ synthase